MGLPSGYLFHIRADALNKADGALVPSVFTDMIGEPFASFSATYHTNQVNGRGVIRFSGSHYIVSNAPYDFSTTDKITVIMVVKANNTTLGMIYEHTANADVDVGFFAHTGSGTNTVSVGATDGAGGNVNKITSSELISSFKILLQTHDRALATNEANLKVNAVATSGTRPLNANLTGNFISAEMFIGQRGGSTLGQAMDLAEIICWPRLLTSTEQIDALVEINQYYKIIPVPTFSTTSPLNAGVVSTAFSQQLNYSGGIGTVTVQYVGDIPPGLTLSSTGLLSGTPNRAGTYTFYAGLSDNGTAPVSYTPFTITITLGASSFYLTTASPLPEASEAVAYSLQFETMNGTGSVTFAKTAGVFPTGVTLSSAGLLSGTPAAAMEGLYFFTVTATDSSGTPKLATKEYQLTVTGNNVHITTTSPLPDGTVGSAYSKQFTHTGGGGGTITYFAGNPVPPGLTFSSSGLLSGTPTLKGDYSIYVDALENGVSDDELEIFTVRINAPVIPMAISTVSPLVGGRVGNFYSTNIEVTDGVEPLSQGTDPSLTAGSLPAGLALSVPGIRGIGAVISGIPTTAGASSFTLKIWDNGGSFATKAFSLTIAAAPALDLVITTPAQLVTSYETISFSKQLATSGGTGSKTYALTGGVLPTGITLSSGGLLSGTPTVPNAYQFTVTATDSLGVTASKTFFLTILTIPEPEEDFPMIDFYTTAAVEIRARYFEPPKDWRAVTSTHDYDDGGGSFNLTADDAPQQWHVEYTFDMNTPADADLCADMDEHFETYKYSSVFYFKDKGGTTHLDVRHKEYEKSHDGHKSWIQTRRIVFERLP